MAWCRQVDQDLVHYIALLGHYEFTDTTVIESVLSYQIDSTYSTYI